jgi:hypothetical protein
MRCPISLSVVAMFGVLLSGCGGMGGVSEPSPNTLAGPNDEFRQNSVVSPNSSRVSRDESDATNTTLDYYRFETGPAGHVPKTIIDSSTHPRKGAVLSGAPDYSSAVPVSTIPQTGEVDKYSLSMATGDSLVFNYPFPFQTLTDATIEFWVYPSSTAGEQEQDVLWGTVGSGDQNRFLIAIDNNNTGTVGLNYRDPSGVQHLLGNSTSIIPFNEWTYFAFVKRGSMYSIYVNDSATKGVTKLESLVGDTSPNLPNSPGWTINGRVIEEPYGCCQFDGLLDEVRISNKALKPSEFLISKP